MAENLKLGATMELTQIRDGEVVDSRVVHNTIVSGGYDLVCSLLGNTTRPNQISHVGVGTGTAATTSSMTSLGTAWGSRVALTYSHTNGTTTMTLAGTIPTHTGSAASITEAGLFNASTSGTMFDRFTFSAINKQTTDTINIQVTINLAD